MADTDDDVTEAHDQRMTVHILTHVPEHQPRETDPHYHLFIAAKARMKRQGLWRCAINDDYCGGNIELHHSHIEFSQVGGSDLDKVNQAFGLHLDSDNEFQEWIESPGNLEPLCEVHHRTHYGVHVIPGPLWEPLRYRKAQAKPSAEFVTQEEFEELDTKTVTKTRVKKGEVDTKTDRVTKVKLKEGDRTVDEVVNKTRTEERRAVPRQRGEKAELKKKSFIGRMFGR
jgi:hypothetical protein